MNFTQFTILLLIVGWVLTLSLVGYKELKEYKTEIQQEAFLNGQLVLIQAIEQNLAVPYFSNRTGNITVEWDSIENICGG